MPAIITRTRGPRVHVLPTMPFQSERTPTPASVDPSGADEIAESEVWASFQKRMEAKKERDRKDLEDNPRWAISWQGSQPVFVLNKYGEPDKRKLIEDGIKSHKSSVKACLEEVNDLLGSVSDYKTRIEKLDTLKSETGASCLTRQ